MDFATIKLVAGETGYSPAALRQKIYRNELIEGEHWVKAPDGRTLISRSAFSSWINSNTNKADQ
jgi:hypothetical protein